MTGAPQGLLLEVRHLSKSFGGARALDGASLEVAPGEVHGLLGENGSGKSTLIKILAGYHAPDGGTVSLRGEPVRLPLPAGQFRRLGMQFVHQDLGVVPSLTVLENLRVGALAAPKNRWFIGWARERAQACEVFSRYDLDLDPAARVADLQPVERALLAIVRAVEDLRLAMSGAWSGRALLFLDEPTAFLPTDHVRRLFDLIRQVVATGASVVLVSHDLEEVLEITDRVTVLRNGQTAGTVTTRETTQNRLVELIIGQQLGPATGAHQGPPTGRTLVRVSDLQGIRLRTTCLSVRACEVVGITGLLGAGYEEIPYLLFGAQRCTSGRLESGDQTVDLTTLTPAKAMAARIALIPADRQAEGSVGSLTLTDNLTLPVLSGYFSALRLLRGRMEHDAASLMQRFDVRPPEPRLQYSALSGGNQQKALLAKWLQIRPRLLLLHEPTQGVDVGARENILSLIRESATEQSAVICASSDYEQLASVCDRVLIFARGAVVAELSGGDVTKERITERCLMSATA